MSDTPETAPAGNGQHASIEVSAEVAAVVVTLAMQDTQTPVAQLCAALERIAASAPAQGEDSQLSRDIATCIQSVQFHDRLIQQLAAVRNLLAAAVNHPPLQTSGFGARRWEELIRSLSDRLTGDTQHHLFDALLRTGAIDLAMRSDLKPVEGSVELF